MRELLRQVRHAPERLLHPWRRRKALEAFAALNELLGHEHYSASDKTKILRRLDQLGLKKSDTGPFAILRQNHGHLVTRRRGAARSRRPESPSSLRD